ncbi:MAG: hypothetical protein NPIRA02_35470 [Nitrospirales bacterium]|nr:MAG: hypothetical protein NPIRA02_35470 [Nitrospirales bacterium]
MILDESSICRFRNLLEAHGLSQQILTVVNTHLAAQGLVLKAGTIVDATLLAAPVSKQNTRKERDPEMSSTRKNNTWHFGAKGHIGVQAQGPPIIHSTALTTAKVYDGLLLEELQHGDEQALFGNSAYTKASRQTPSQTGRLLLRSLGPRLPQASLVLVAKKTQSPAFKYSREGGTSLPGDQTPVGTPQAPL